MDLDLFEQKLHISRWLQPKQPAQLESHWRRNFPINRSAQLRVHAVLEQVTPFQSKTSHAQVDAGDWQVARQAVEGLSWDTWVRAGLEQLSSERPQLEASIRDALLAVWTEAFRQLPLIRAVITGDCIIGGPRQSRALLVEDPTHGELQYRFDKQSRLSASPVDMRRVLDAGAQRYRPGALASTHPAKLEGFAALTLKDPSEDFSWRTQLDLALLLSPETACKWADTAKDIWASCIFPLYRRSHYGILSRFLHCKIPHLPELLAAEGFTDSETLMTQLDCRRPHGVYRRLITLSDRPGLAAATRHRNERSEDPRRPVMPCVLPQLLNNIELAQPKSDLKFYDYTVPRHAVACINQLSVEAVEALSFDLNFVTAILMILPPHLHPMSAREQQRFAEFFAPLQDYSREQEHHPKDVVLLAACRQYELRPDTQLPTMRQELRDLIDFLIFARPFCPRGMTADGCRYSGIWDDLGKPVLSEMIDASRSWHTALNTATAAIDDGRPSRRKNETRKCAEWPPLLTEPAVIDGISFHCLVSPMDLREEGQAMSNCVGGYSDICRSGKHILSARRGNERVATLTVWSPRISRKFWMVEDCLATNNKPAEPIVAEAAEKLVSELNSGDRLTNPDVETFAYEEVSSNDPIFMGRELIEQLIQQRMTGHLKRFEVILRCGKRRTPASQAFRAATTRQDS